MHREKGEFISLSRSCSGLSQNAKFISGNQLKFDALLIRVDVLEQQTKADLRPVRQMYGHIWAHTHIHQTAAGQLCTVSSMVFLTFRLVLCTVAQVIALEKNQT